MVSANGPLSTPRMPELDGLGHFKGEAFHTAQWNYDVDLKGKKVGVIGTGARRIRQPFPEVLGPGEPQ